MLLVYFALFYTAMVASGLALKKARIPKIYAALFLGIFLSGWGSAQSFASALPVKVLSQIGVLMLLFLLGYGVDLGKMRRQGRLVTKVTFWIILAESTFGILVLHFLFQVGWPLAAIIAASFATIGEVALLPILKEFKLINTSLGQTILGVAILDDVVEVATFVLLIFFLGGLSATDFFSQISPLLSIVAGAIVGNVFKPNVKFNKKLEFAAYYLFGPLFFFVAGMESRLDILFHKLPLILLLTLGVKLTKISTVYIVAHKELGTKKAIILGVCTGVKFSTSIIILILLLHRGLINEDLFATLIGVNVVFKIVVPILLSALLTRWKLDLKDTSAAAEAPVMQSLTSGNH